MSLFQRERDRERLEQEIQTDAYRKLLRGLQLGNPFLRQFETWADVIAFMRAGTSDDPQKDEVLRPILAANRNDRDPRWQTILLVIFWPGLYSIHHQKRHWDEDAEELWHNVALIFLEIVFRIDVSRRPQRLVQKAFNDTVHHLHDEYRRIWDDLNRQDAAPCGESNRFAGVVDGIDTTEMELREAQELETRRLREHADAGRISEADFHLLIGTRVYGKSVVDYARNAGLSFETAKKRRQGAERVIRLFEKKLR